MADKTGISWTDATWNPVRGCSRVSEGCRNCYAERVAARFSLAGMPYHGLADQTRTGSKWTGKVQLFPDKLSDPLKWRRPRRVFVNSMSDLFHEELTNEQIAAVFGVMAAAPQHTFQILTKRAKRMREWFEWMKGALPLKDQNWDPRAAACWDFTKKVMPGAIESSAWNSEFMDRAHTIPWPLPNVWLGVSVENQEAADERIPELLRAPAAVRFLSCEPLLWPTDLHREWLAPFHDVDPMLRPTPRVAWVIAGCESGPRARPCKVEWLRSLRDQCAAAGVPFFLKQATGEQRNSIGGSRHMVPVARVRDGSFGAIRAGDGSKPKGGGVIELPYLDGVQHRSFPNDR